MSLRWSVPRCLGCVFVITTLVTPTHASSRELAIAAVENQQESRHTEKVKFKDWVRREKVAWNKLKRTEKAAVKADTAEEFYQKLQPAGREWGKTQKALGVELLSGKWSSKISAEIEELGTLYIADGSFAILVFEAKNYGEYVQRSKTRVSSSDPGGNKLIALINSKLGG